MNPAPFVLVAAGCAAVAAGAAIRALFRPGPPAARRLRPYLAWSRSRLGLPPEAGYGSGGNESGTRSRYLARLAGALGDEALDLKLVQAGILRGAPAAERVLRYRMRRFLVAAAGGAAAGLMAGLRGVEPVGALVLVGLGVGGAVAYGRGRLDRLVEQRRSRIRIELYSVELLLAVQLRVGSSVAAALRHLVVRTDGVVVGELTEALRLHDGGMGLSQALRRIARTTPEPHAMRCYRTLAAGHDHGADVAASMLALSEDIRNDRREALRRAATKRRALMLVPIVGILAPVLLLFVGAPLPWMVLRGLG